MRRRAYSKGFFIPAAQPIHRGHKTVNIGSSPVIKRRLSAVFGIGAICILFVLCVIRGLGQKFIWQGSFWEGFLYPFVLFFAIFIISTILYVLMKKAPKAGSFVFGVLLILSIVFLAGIVLLIIVLLLNSFLHFWF